MIIYDRKLNFEHLGESRLDLGYEPLETLLVSICLYVYICIYIYIHIHCFTRLCFALPRSPNDQLDHSWWFSATPGPT